MTIRNMDGQMDFLGLITEYKDSQGASVRVREPVKQKLRIMPGSDYEQISFDFGTVISDAEPMAHDDVNVMTDELLHDGISENINNREDNIEDNNIVAEMSPASEEAKPKERAKKEEKTDYIDATEKEVQVESVEKPETVEKPQIVKDVLFKQCKKCWCYDCRHNARNEGVPREICGTQMACPACNDCINEDMATICEIGNAREGCRTRALEEGIADDMEMSEY